MIGKKVLVTCSAGFIGSDRARYLFLKITKVVQINIIGRLQKDNSQQKPLLIDV